MQWHAHTNNRDVQPRAPLFMFVRIGKRNRGFYFLVPLFTKWFCFCCSIYNRRTNCGLFTLVGCVAARSFPFRFLFYFHRSICWNHVYSYVRGGYDMCGICIYSLADRGHGNFLCSEWIGINTYSKRIIHAFPSSRLLSTVFTFGAHVFVITTKPHQKPRSETVHKHTQNIISAFINQCTSYCY